jgi:hypothetical protein
VPHPAMLLRDDLLREEDAEFQTPFQAGCTSGPQDCVPTRIKERYRLDVTDKRPQSRSYLDRLDKKLRHCYRLFLDSPVGRMIKQRLPMLKTIAQGQIQRPQSHVDENCEVFCLLKAQFQQHLKACPDELSCRLGKEVACLNCPVETGDNYGSAMAEAFSKLFELIHRYQYDRVLADLVFSCDAPEEACCVPLGCVQVEDGCVTRVNNSPRDSRPSAPHKPVPARYWRTTRHKPRRKRPSWKKEGLGRSAYGTAVCR